jgi:hypothetical protein
MSAFYKVQYSLLEQLFQQNEAMLERRANRRLQPRRTVVTWLCGGGHMSQAALLIDVSNSGIGLLVSRPVPPEWLVLTEMPQIQTRLLGRVVYHLQQPDDTWRMGVRLSHDLHPGDMAALDGE